MKITNDMYYIWMTQVFGIAKPKIHQLIEEHGSAGNVYSFIMEGDRSSLTQKEKEMIDYVTMEKVAKLISYCEKRNIGICSLGSRNYPKLLAQMYNPPAVIYYRGDLSCLDEMSLTFVGTREPSAYIKKLCTKITRDIGSRGITLVSGMARGIDECVHMTCVNNGLKTVGVLACGIEYDYPFMSSILREKIVMNGGAYLTELLPPTVPTKEYFNPRNRILAGLTRGTAVFQAAINSGSLITASYAVNEGRDVFCVPPPDIYDPQYEGVIGFLEDGAIPIFNHDDILREYEGIYI